MAFSNLWIFDIYHDYFYNFNIFSFSKNCRRIRGGGDTESDMQKVENLSPADFDLKFLPFGKLKVI
jgi:hypothetical protein